MIFKSAITGILFVLYATVLGKGFLSYIGWKSSFKKDFSWGCIIVFAVTQIVAYPLYRLGMSFRLFFIIMTIALLVLFVLSAIKLKTAHITVPSIRLNSSNALLFVILFVTIVALFIYSLCFYYPTTDDGYYMTRAMEVIRQNRMDINVRDAWLGWSNGEMPDYTDASSFAFLTAYISYISGIQATILSKGALAVCLIAVHICAVAVAAESFFKDMHKREKTSCVIILYILFQIMSVKPSSGGIWMTGYIWNGKSLLPGFIFPMILASCCKLMKHVEDDICRRREWLSITLVLIAGICVSVVGLNLPIILYFTYGLSFLILTKFKYFSKIWKGAVLSALPVAFYAVLSYMFVVTGQNDYYEAGTTTVINWAEQFLEAIDFWQFALFAACSIYLLFRGDKMCKLFFVLAPLILFISFLNPVLKDLVAKYITSSLVYWRLWWLVPVYIVPAIALTDLLDRLTQGCIQNGLVCMAMSLIIMSGYEIFRYCITDPEYSIVPYIENVGKLINVRPELRFNQYGINGATYLTAEAIINDQDACDTARVLMFFNRPFELRQYSTDIKMVCGIRDIQLSDNIIPGTEISEREFMTTYSTIEDGDYLRSILETLDTDYICFDGKSAVRNLENYGFIHIQDYAGISLWKVG